MNFFKNPKNWKQELSAIFLTVGSFFFILSFFLLGDSTVWLITISPLLFVPVVLGSFWKMKVPAFFILLVSGLIICHSYTLFAPIKYESPNGTVFFLVPKGYNNCYRVHIGEQIFQTSASIYQNIYPKWQDDNSFILDSSDVGIIEFRKENEHWITSPDELSRELPSDTNHRP